jgi:hypothetical protein
VRLPSRTRKKVRRVQRSHTILTADHPPRRPVLVGQGKLKPPRQSDKRFLKNNFSSLPPGLYSPANSLTSSRVDKRYAEEIMGV